MLNVSFKNIPSAYREYFERAGFKMEKGGLFKKPTETQPIEVYEAEEYLKKLVDRLNDSEDIELSMTVYDDEDEKEYNLDNVHVTTETQGLEDLADQVAVENGNDDESMNLVWLLHDQLDHADSDDDEEDEEEDYEEDYEDDQDTYQDDFDLGSDIQSPIASASPVENSEAAFSAPAEEKQDFVPAPATKYNFDDEPDAETKASVSLKDLTAPSVISLSEYADSSLIDKAVAAYAGESLNVNQQAKAWGLTDDPKDKFDRQLNAAIISEMAKHDLASARGKFLSTLGGLKNDALDDLTKYYQIINSQTLADAAGTMAEDELQDLKEEIQEDNAKLLNESKNRQIVKKQQLKEETESLVEKYRAELEAKNKLTLEDFANQCEKELKSRKQENENKYKERFDELKTEKQKAIADSRSQDLEKYRQDQLAALTQAALTAFEKANGDLSQGLKEISPVIESAVKKIDAEREAAKKEADAAVARQKALELRERQLAIDEFAAKEEQRVHDAELSLKRQELEYHNQLLTRSFERPFDAYSAPSRHDAYTAPSRKVDAYSGASQNGQGRENRDHTAPSEQQADDSSSAGPELAPDAQTAPASTNAPAKKASEESKATAVEPESLKGDDLTDRDKRHLKNFCAFAVFFALSASIGGAYWNVYQDGDFSTPTAALSGKKTAEKASAFSSSMAKSGSNKAMSKAQKKKEIAQLEASQAKLMKKYEKLKKTKKNAYGYAGYMKASTSTGKMEQLDAMLGQQDVKSLRKINKADATKTSRLYQALADGSDSQARVLWLSMSKKERADLSKLARNSVALSFYSVSDWQHGWQAKEGV
ncbi:hypothetical protein PF586_06845 [Lactobacillus delbrueckii]|uniref:Uncharacterized protein n=1 Tax=Lactobacillus delbrueckii TaxID=1584 RepID=A0AAW5YVQ7_9LACO|nr:hypothetical protein [Lactobacillus delbrueckii]MDA3768174.1 hypothetical protein [Lactobacillus delbrueckii]